ncbi:Uncharacterised protein [Cedecea lapagei]|uniref:Uncharacterized protein n=1 Tax=Cedecea lapagei TaxID=158823 RepID=A0A3S4MGB3_9ENTR|nr:hypothetical protein [Cedecea lapagei]VEC00504.1 Uncharacterised protein [Cedecea lapagei]
MKSILAGSAIVGTALIVSSLISSGPVLFKSENIISITGGSVKLGNIYDEHKVVSVKMIFDDSVSNEEFLDQANADDYKVAYKDKLTEVANLINKGRKEDEKTTVENLKLTKPAKLEITTAVRYRSEYQPVFTLVLGTKTVDLPVGTQVYAKSIESVDAFLKEQKPLFDSALYLKK